MIRKFGRDRRGNYTLMTVITMVPLMGGVALSVDYSELLRQKHATLNALDAAGLATAQQVVSGATDDAARAYAKTFFETNLGPVDPANTSLTVTLPNSNAGGGTLKLCSALTYHPYFLPAAAMLLGGGTTSGGTTFTECSEIRLKNTLEVALVLDNSGSMNDLGSGTGEKRIDLLKTAAKQLVDTLALQAQQMKQVSKPVQFSLVPFAASVNVGPTHDLDNWMDQDGISPIQHEDFDWTKMTAANDPDKYAEKLNGVWYKRGTGWGDTEDQPLTRFSLFADMTVESGREEVPNSRQYICDEYRRNGTCRTGHWTTPEYIYTTSRYASWQGCVEARPYPYNNDDTTPSTATPATLFVPMFAPDEAGTLWLDFNRDGANDVTYLSYGYGNNWWADWPYYTDSPTASQRQSDMRKYFLVKPYGSKSANAGDGPNSSCTTNPITPLKDVTQLAQKEEIDNAIDAMAPNGNTNVPEGLAWGWRTVSSNEPFTEGRPNAERGNDKVVIVLTDGANTYSAVSDSSYANNRSTYAAYGYTGLTYPGSGSVTRLFMNTSTNIGKTTYTGANYTAALDEQMQTLCGNAKKSNVLVMTVALDLSTTDAVDKNALDALKACSSDSRFRKDPTDPSKPAKLFWNATGATLSDNFKEIANELSNLRIVG
ncbi:TadE/TadG family type IV pilus assembly protein [Mesorhizobium sp.]|uniref:TadE/TadG family type IV pilus assembly protein n=1 Tax=Mesorhizobium sp. TaxID=1871066 RepID=UPI000FEA36A3|nr:TadE/TadG family type IV pilus assembly protein [Mesorhizobium sp.]RWI13722.1 MAG: TadE/TadG family protein [Mesorhizobium sp.]RWK47626.1 MAG: TadE/TadG family protein [Mesorhizobium sp.]RWK93130.1 MAG: TadE/TadG family protein [Mesorhizobium sp.]TIP98881.1 MAG: TadE/TadG family protein [Mesorhizobium sp.]TIQ25939.1 MAG: TadE/TadG family protein [Mesorhizobium sp.]